nr:reverse transcriptase domain-containing protein [Tanacetum cinerariifolium]
LLTKFVNSNSASTSSSGAIPSNTIANPRKAKKDTVHPTNNESTKDVQPQVVPTESQILNYEPVNSPTIEPVASPVSSPRPNQRPSIPYPSILQDQKLRDKANDQREKIFQIFKDLNFNISFADDLILMPKFGPSIKSLLTNKDKLCELARTPLNEHCLAVLLKKLPEKLGDLDKFLIPCDFSRKAECLAFANLGASINLMPLSVWNNLSLPDLSPTCMTLELADRSISHPVGVAEDVYVKVEAKKDTVHPTNNESTKDVQPQVVPTESQILNYEPVNSPTIEPVASPVSSPRPNQRPSIPYPSILQDQKLRDKANDQREKIFQIFKDLNFNISFADDLILMPKFGPSIKSLLTNKDKLCELARTPLNEHCLAVLLSV